MIEMIELGEVENRLNRIKDKGFDTLDLYDLLEKIKSNDLSAFSREETVLPITVDSIYSNLVKRIEEYEEYIRLRNVLFSFYSFKKERHGIEEVDSAVSAILECFYNIKKEFSSYPKFQDVYNVLYDIIKYEVKIKNNSRVMDAIVSFSKDAFEINKLISKDIDKINDKDIKDESIVADMNFMAVKCKNSEEGFLNVEFIKLINNCFKVNETIFDINKRLDETIVGLKNAINSVNSVINPLENRVKSTSYDRKVQKPVVLKKLASLGLAGLLVSGVAGCGTTMANHLSKETVYLTTTQEFVKGKGLSEPITEYKPKQFREEEKTLTIAKYENVLDSEVTVRSYNLDKLDLGGIEEYIDVDVKHYRLESDGRPYYTSNNEYLIEKDEEYRKVVFSTQDWNVHEETVREGLKFFFNLLTACACVGASFIPKIGLLKNLKEFIKNMKIYIKDNISNYDALVELELAMDECSGELKNDYESISDFYNIYNQAPEYCDMEKVEEIRDLIEKRAVLIKKLDR